MSGARRLETRIRSAASEGRIALMPYVIAGHPTLDGFARTLLQVANEADVVEVGLPFTDPTADGPVIAEAARKALAGGANLDHALAAVKEARAASEACFVLMSYLNPLLARGAERVCKELVEAGFDGLIVPDLPLEESLELREPADASGLALIQLVTPLTPTERIAKLSAATRGFLYAVTRKGTTGARAEAESIHAYLDRVGSVCGLPICAGFGLREPDQVQALLGHAHGAVVGTALVERLSAGEDPRPFLQEFRGPGCNSQ
jgi:tryptophan synthase alpha chain